MPLKILSNFIKYPKTLIVLSIFFVHNSVSLASIGSETSKLNLLSFQEWKVQKINEANTILKVAKMDSKLGLSKQKLSEGDDKALILEARLEQARRKIKWSKELSIKDYFASYLSPRGSKEVFSKIQAKLSKDELAELLLLFSEEIQKL